MADQEEAIMGHVGVTSGKTLAEALGATLKKVAVQMQERDIPYDKTTILEFEGVEITLTPEQVNDFLAGKVTIEEILPADKLEEMNNPKCGADRIVVTDAMIARRPFVLDDEIKKGVITGYVEVADYSAATLRKVALAEDDKVNLAAKVLDKLVDLHVLQEETWNNKILEKAFDVAGEIAEAEIKKLMRRRDMAYSMAEFAEDYEREHPEVLAPKETTAAS